MRPDLSTLMQERSRLWSSVSRHQRVLQALPVLVGLVLGGYALQDSADAQGQKAIAPAVQNATPTAQQPSAAQASAQANSSAVPAIDRPLTLILIRSALLALQQANETGNYSVMRELGSPEFQASHSSARLAESFANLRLQKIDLSPISVLDPELPQPIRFENNILKIKGFFPSSPLQVQFDLAFTPLGGKWRLTSLTLDMIAAPAPTGAVVPKQGK
jgi:hypothetical protein